MKKHQKTGTGVENNEREKEARAQKPSKNNMSCK
jgi:hypothetical protein